MDITSLEYKRAFEEYIRRGTPVPLTLKPQQRTTTHYIWRTRCDGKVRPEHAANDGRIFAWDNPPPTGHPGEDYGCRCWAEAYEPEIEESLEIRLLNVTDDGSPWSNADFVDHYFNGNGATVTVRETGHLRNIVKRYMALAETSLLNNIARVARSVQTGLFSDYFERAYDMEGVTFSIGNTAIEGKFSGAVNRKLDLLYIQGEISFMLDDVFADPADLLNLYNGEGTDIEIIDLGRTLYENIHRPLENYLRGKPTGPIRYGIHTGKPYKILDHWDGVFDGVVTVNASQSRFK